MTARRTRVPGLVSVPTDTKLVRATSIQEYYTDFDGSTEYVDGGDNFNFGWLNAFTVCAWIRKTGGGVSSMVARRQSAGNRKGWALAVQGGPVRFYLTSVATTSEWVISSTGITITDGGWHLIVAAYTGTGSITGMSLYDNGVDVEDPTPVVNNLSANPADSTTRFAIMADNDTVNGVGNYTSEDLADVRIFNAALSAAEVLDLYNGGSIIDHNDWAKLHPVAAGNLQAWYRMGDGRGFEDYDAGVVRDFSGNGVNGTPVNLSSADIIAGGP